MKDRSLDNKGRYFGNVLYVKVKPRNNSILHSEYNTVAIVLVKKGNNSRKIK